MEGHTVDQAGRCSEPVRCYMDNGCLAGRDQPRSTVTGKGNLMALDASSASTANALFRHPEIVAYRDLDEEDPAEVEASKFDLAYISLDGDIGCLVNGAGRDGDDGHHQAVRRRGRPTSWTSAAGGGREGDRGLR